MERKIRRGDIFYANLDPVIGSEQGGERPVLIIQNDKGNQHSPTVIVAAVTSRVNKKKSLPTHIPIECTAILLSRAFSTSFLFSLILLISIILIHPFLFYN